MRVLVLAPHPFYQERGTPIDVDILVRALSAREGTTVDLLVYGEGEDHAYENVTLHRIADLRLLRGVRPGFSAKKLLADLLLFWKARALLREHRYDVIHAGEEAAFLALFFRRVHGIPFVYDLDSSVAQQMVESRPALAFLGRALGALEGWAISRAIATAPVCNALADLCRSRGAAKVVTLHDISQLADPDAPRSGALRREVGSERLLLVYAGNLEPYQGIDLLLESFARAAARSDAVDLVVIGGVPEDVAHYRRKAEALGLAGRAHLIGPRPFQELDRYLADADVLVAPRIRGVNTPMKVFPYLHSGRPVLVTDLPTHAQILTDEVAYLAPPTVEGFGDAIVELAENASLRERLGRAGRAFVERDHTFAAHRRRVDALYDWVEQEIARERGLAGP